MTELEQVFVTTLYVCVIIMNLILLSAVIRSNFPTKIVCGILTASSFSSDIFVR